MNRSFSLLSSVPTSGGVRPARLAGLGALALLLLPLAAHAGQDDAPVTLRMKFKQGAVNRYKMTQTMRMKLDAPGQPTPTLPETVSTMVMEQKVIKLRDEGGAVFKTTTKEIHIKAGDSETPAPEIPEITTEMDALGKVISMKGLADTGNPMMSTMNSMFGGAGLSGMSAFLPENAVKVGDTWDKEITLPEMLGGAKGVMKCAFVKIETVGGYKTARIHTELTAPLNAMISTMGKPTRNAGEAMMTMDGTISSISDVNFAIAEGKNVRVVSKGGGAITMKPNKDAPNAGQLPSEMKMDMNITADMNLLPPASAGAKPSKAPSKTPKKRRTSA